MQTHHKGLHISHRGVLVDDLGHAHIIDPPRGALRICYTKTKVIMVALHRNEDLVFLRGIVFPTEG